MFYINISRNEQALKRTYTKFFSNDSLMIYKVSNTTVIINLRTIELTLKIKRTRQKHSYMNLIRHNKYRNTSTNSSEAHNINPTLEVKLLKKVNAKSKK